MPSALSTLGLGSSGALSFDVIDQLRAVDDKAQVKPIENKIDLNTTQQKDLSSLSILAASLKSVTSSLSSESSYLKTATSVSGESASVVVSDGVADQKFSLVVTDLAQSQILQSKAFANETDTFATVNDTININIDGKDYGIDVTASTTLLDFKNMIFEKTDGKVTASLLNVGGATPFKLIFKSTDTGDTQNMTITSTGTTATNLTLTQVQPAQNAAFTYNGVDIVRQSNSIDDLLVGVSIELKDIGTSNVSISNDTSPIKTNIEEFVSKYNDLINNLSEATKYDPETNTKGVFQGVSEIVGIKSSINRIVFAFDAQGGNLAEYGVTLNSNGLLELDSETLDAKIAADPQGMQDYFRGSGENLGVFAKLNDTLAGLVSDKDSVLSSYSTTLGNQQKSLEQDRLDTIAKLDSRYEIMTKKFAAYDSIIGKLNAQFSSLSLMIEQSVTNK